MEVFSRIGTAIRYFVNAQIAVKIYLFPCLDVTWTGEVDMNLLHRRTSQCLLHLTPTSFRSLAILVADGTLRDEQPHVFSPSLPVSNLLQFLSGFLYPEMSINESSMRILKKLTPQRMRYNHLLILNRCIWPLVVAIQDTIDHLQ